MAQASIDGDCLLDALRTTTGKRSELLAALRNVTECMTSSETDSGLKYRILIELVDILKPCTVGLLTVNEFKEQFGSAIRSAPIDDALIVFVNALHSCDKTQIFRLQHIIILLDDLEKTCLKSLLIESITKNPNDENWNARIEELSKLLGQTTCLLHNALGDSRFSSQINSTDTLLDAYMSNHWIYMLNGVKAALISAAERCQNSKDVNLKFIAGVVYQLCHGDTNAFRKLIYWLGLQSSAIWSRICARLLTDTSNGLAQCENLLTVVLRAARDGEMLEKLFGNEICENRIVKRVFFEKALFVKIFPANERIPEKLATCLRFGNCNPNGKGPWSELHKETICTALNVWANNVHVNHSCDEQLDYIDIVLLNFVIYASEHIRREVVSEVTAAITAGVNIRLRCPDIRRRLRGMYIAELLTKWFSLGELKFEYPSEINEFISDIKEIVEDDNMIVDRRKIENDSTKEEKEEEEEKNKVVELKVQDTQNATVGEIDSDDDDFPDYEIPEEETILQKKGDDDEDYHHVDTPHYIRDCIERLGESNDYANFEAAFNVLDPMIRRRAVGYEQSAEELLRRLIYLTDRFGTDRFQEKRLQLIVSCLVTSPHLGSIAVEIMFSRRCSMIDRYTILKALSDAATEYSSPAAVAQSQEPEPPTNEGGKVLIRGELVPRIKRFKKVPAVPLKENKFTPVANAFFYPLTAVDQYREHLDLLGRDSELLSRILFCLGQLIKCSGACSCTIGMANTLTRLLIPLRHHENFAVRQAVVFCYASICISISKDVLLQLYSEELNDWCEYTMKLAKGDPSSECRQMAQMATEIIAQSVMFDDD